MKRYLAVLIAVIMSLSVSALAVNENEEATFNPISVENPVTLTSLDLNSLPIYFVTSVEGDTRTTANDDSVALSMEEKESLLVNPVFGPVLKNADELASSGVTVDCINIKLPAGVTYASIAGGDPNDPTYWENLSVPMTTYNGYTIRYIETELPFNTGNYMTVDNIKAGTNWKDVLAATFEVGFRGLVDRVTNVFTVYDNLSAIIDAAKPPLNINYEFGPSEFVKYRAEGTQYTRVIIVKDTENRVPGYAYYNYGQTMQAKVNNEMSVSYPIGWRTPTTKDYEHKVGVVGTAVHSTPNFYGTTFLYREVVNRYTSPISAPPYSEYIDLKDIIRKMV